MMKLSDKLRQWRAERPDEWKMDEFIRLAEEIEGALYTHQYSDFGTLKQCSIVVDKRDARGHVVIINTYGEYLTIEDCELIPL